MSTLRAGIQRETPANGTSIDFTLIHSNGIERRHGVELLPDMLAKISPVWAGQERADAASLRFFTAVVRSLADAILVRIESVVSRSPLQKSPVGQPLPASEPHPVAGQSVPSLLPEAQTGTLGTSQAGCDRLAESALQHLAPDRTEQTRPCPHSDEPPSGVKADLATIATGLRIIDHERPTTETANSLIDHILAMADDSYLMGHPEWVEIANEARAARTPSNAGTAAAHTRNPLNGHLSRL
jgi:hypothetical protein